MMIARPTVASAAATAMTMQRDHRARLAPSRCDERPERDDREVDRVEHQLDRHQHADRVAPGEEAEHPDREQERREDEVGVERVASRRRPGRSARGRRRTPTTSADPTKTRITPASSGLALALGEEDAADHGGEQQHADDLERQHPVGEEGLASVVGRVSTALGRARPSRSARIARTDDEREQRPRRARPAPPGSGRRAATAPTSSGSA